jgi:hypothetical protein
MDDGPRPIGYRHEIAQVTRQSGRVVLRTSVAAVVLTALTWLAP